LAALKGKDKVSVGHAFNVVRGREGQAVPHDLVVWQPKGKPMSGPHSSYLDIVTNSMERE